MSEALHQPLYMLKLPVDQRRLYAFANSQRLMTVGETDDGYVLHALLAALFGVDAPKPFAWAPRQERYPDDPRSATRYLLGYSGHTKGDLEEIARLHALPDVYAAVDWEAAACKPMPSSFRQDQPLDFAVRLLPMVRAGRHHPTFRPGAEVDVFLLKAEAKRDAPKPDRERIYGEWLAHQLSRGGAEMLSFEMTARRRTTLLRKKADGTRHQSRQHPDLDVSGTLIVRDPSAFRNYLARGVGRHRAFGYGMLLLKPRRR